MSYHDACIAYVRAWDYHYRMFLSGDQARIFGALNLLAIADRRRRRLAQPN